MSLLSRLRKPELHHVAVYGLSIGLAALLTLVLTRVLWHALSPVDFGIWALIDPMMFPAASLVMLGMEHGIVKQIRVDHLPLRLVIGSLLVSTLPTSSLCLLVIGLVAHFAFRLGWTEALLLTMAGEALIALMQTAFRATGAVYSFATLLLSRNLLYLAVLLVARVASAPAPVSVAFVFLTRGICVFLVSLIALAVLRPVLHVDRARYRDALRYGFPLLLTTFIYAVADMTDRWFLARFTGIAAVGIYALHLKLAAILSQAIVLPFGLWFAPERFRHLDDPDGGQGFFIRTAVAVALICGYLSGIVWLSRDFLLSLLAPGIAASPQVLAFCLGSVVCLALSQALNVGLLMPGHTGKNAICNVYMVAATVLGAAILVPLMGMTGAATSRLLGGLVMLVATAAWANRVLPIAFPFFSLLLYFVASVTAAIGIDRSASGTGFVALFTALALWTGVFCLFAAVFWSRLRIVPADRKVLTPASGQDPVGS